MLISSKHIRALSANGIRLSIECGPAYLTIGDIEVELKPLDWIRLSLVLAHIKDPPTLLWTRDLVDWINTLHELQQMQEFDLLFTVSVYAVRNTEFIRLDLTKLDQFIGLLPKGG